MLGYVCDIIRMGKRSSQVCSTYSFKILFISYIILKDVYLDVNYLTMNFKRLK